MHDNTQSLAYKSTENIRGGYMHLIERFQTVGAPFLGYLHTNGFCVARTDRQPTSRVIYHQKVKGVWGGRFTADILDTRLKEMLDAPGIYEIVSVKVLPEKQWYCLSKAGLSGIRKAAQKIYRHQGIGRPCLLETVESDGETTTYLRYG